MQNKKVELLLTFLSQAFDLHVFKASFNDESFIFADETLAGFISFEKMVDCTVEASLFEYFNIQKLNYDV